MTYERSEKKGLCRNWMHKQSKEYYVWKCLNTYLSVSGSQGID